MLEYLRSPPHASVGWLTASGLRGGIYFFLVCLSQFVSPRHCSDFCRVGAG